MHRREGERKVLKRKLERNVNIHMPAPRRIGKTWTINRLAEDLRKANWLVVELDVQGMAKPDEFARALCDRIQKQLPASSGLTAGVKARVKNIIGGGWDGTPIEAIGKIDPISFLETLIEQLTEENADVAILVDEIAFFLLAIAERDPGLAKEFFYRLRGLQLQYRSVRWLLTGSIGLNVVSRRFGLEGAFVDLETFILEPFTADEARSYLLDADIQETFNHRFVAADADLDHMFNELGWLAPYYLTLIANALRPSGPSVDGVATATRADFDAAFDALIKPGRKAEFAVWREHVDKNLPDPDQGIARAVLNRLSQEADGEIRDTLLAALPATSMARLGDVLDILENDGLVIKVEGRYRFRSGLVRRYWKEYEAL